MHLTWTLSQLINQREYGETEKIVLEYFFTNINKNVYCAKDTLPSQVWAFLMWQYSRSHLSLRDRFLKVFEDQKVAFEAWKIWKDEFISLEDLAEYIKSNNDNKLQYFYDRAASFLKKWWVEYWHNSLKDSDYIRFAVEGVSEVLTKVIESPFPALWAFQETSTRYMPFSKDHILIPEEISNSPFAEEVREKLFTLFDVYEKWLVVVKEALLSNGIFKQEDFSSLGSFNTTLNTKVFDICRYLLPSATATKLWCSFQTRTLESHLSWMLSHPLAEARMVAKAIWEEAIKISPWLLSHVWINDYEINRISSTYNIVNDIFKVEEKIYKGIPSSDRVKIIKIDDLDTEVVAWLIFESSRTSWKSYFECLNYAKGLTDSDKRKIMDSALLTRGKFDRMPRSILHTRVISEFLMDFWAYRDLQRHRASDQIWQWVTSIHWYDYPEYIDLPWMESFKEMYDAVMTDITLLSRKLTKQYPYAIEYIAALGHLVRSTFEMDAGQFAYVIELRTTPHAHHSYRNLLISLYEQVKEVSPIFASYIRCWSGDASRKEEAERIESNKSK